MSREPEFSDRPAIPDELGAAIVRVFNGDATDAHRAAVEAWSSVSPERAAMLDDLQVVWQRANPTTTSWNVERALDAVRAADTIATAPHDRVRSAAPRPVRVPSAGYPPSSIRRRFGMAATTVAAVALVVAGYVGFRHRTVPAVSIHVYATRAAERATVHLADGSTAELAPQTRLTVRGTAMELIGEAYFVVAHDHRTPFVVQTGAVTTRVLGTTFSVRRYADDRETRVAVTSGKVAVSGRRQPITLVSGNVGRVTDSTEIVTENDATQYTAWTNGQLVFHDTPLSELLTTVGRWYGVRFRLADSTLADRRITATVDLGSQTEFMRALGLVLDARLTFSDSSNRVILIQSGRDALAPLRHDRMELAHTAKEIGR